MPGVLFGSIHYSVEFSGVKERKLLKEVKQVSQLLSSAKDPSISLSALQYRAIADVEEIVKVLHAYGYYEANVTFSIEPYGKWFEVLFRISLGAQYEIESFRIDSDGTLLASPIQPGAPALSVTVVAAERTSIEELTRAGHPFAQIEKKEYIVDGETKRLYGTLYIEPGPFCRFGKVVVEGSSSVLPRFIEKNLLWKEGEPFDSRLLNQTQDALMDSHLFGSVAISPLPLEEGSALLPILVEVVESKHKSVNFGVSYQTFFGLGATFGWENRNMGGLGRLFSFQADVTKRSVIGNALLRIPILDHRGRDFVMQAEAMHESITAYSMQSYSAASRLEHTWNHWSSFSFGGMFERLYVLDSGDNGNFFLLAAPLYVRFSNSNDLLNPTRGISTEFRLIPTANLSDRENSYGTGEFSFAWYWSFEPKGLVTIAQQVTIGSALSESLHAIPVPKRFFGGSEEDLRGYKYKTVSPLDSEGQPIGGRSALFYSLELRLRPFQVLGFVPFFDLGNVNKSALPGGEEKWFRSVGVGLRYFSVFGPFRLDVGFPLDRRPNIDSRYRILVSVGQAF